MSDKKDRKTVVCGEYPEVIGWLDDHDFDVLTVRRSEILPPPVARHADMLCFSCGDGRGFIYDGALCEQLRLRGFDYRAPSVPLGSRYPQDIRLNCLVIGKYLIANARHIAPEITEWAERSGFEIVNVRQGYARCSTLALGDSAAITADIGIAAALRERSIDVLQITPGHIRLDGYDYGFIGGASAVVGDTVLFCGDPHTHTCGAEMLRFIEKYGFKVEFTASHELIDFGSCVIV